APGPAAQNGGITPQGGASSVVARREGSRGAVGQQHSSKVLPGAGTRAEGPSRQRGRGRWRQDAARARRPDLVTATRGRSPQGCPSSTAGSSARAGGSLPAA